MIPGVMRARAGALEGEGEDRKEHKFIGRTKGSSVTLQEQQRVSRRTPEL